MKNVDALAVGYKDFCFLVIGLTCSTASAARGLINDKICKLNCKIKIIVTFAAGKSFTTSSC
jgi:hypothetical protein